MAELGVSIVTFYHCCQLYRVYKTYWATEPCKKNLKIRKGLSESINRRMRDNTMAKWKQTKDITKWQIKPTAICRCLEAYHLRCFSSSEPTPTVIWLWSYFSDHNHRVTWILLHYIF